jgi:hypothetical protein
MAEQLTASFEGVFEGSYATPVDVEAAYTPARVAE